MARIKAAVILIVALILISTVPFPAMAAPTLQTDQPLYTQRDKQVTLVGSGFTSSQPYFVWIKTPADSKTHSTGTSFTPIAGGLVPPEIVLPLSANATLGTYLVSVSTFGAIDNSQATTHFGVWGTMKPLYQRSQSVKVMGGGLFPGTSLKLTIRNPAGIFVHDATLASTADGDFNNTWRIPEDAVTDLYTIIIDGTGTFDNPQQDYISQTKFTVTQATLSVKIGQQPNPSYERTEKATVSLNLQYPDGSPVVKLKQAISPFILLQDQVTVGFATATLADAVNGIWTVESKIQVNATLSGKYRFELPAMSFDDGFGNKGGAVDAFSDYFQVRGASFVIKSEVNGTQIQIPFGQVSIISKVTYPDGTSLTNGTVRATLSTGSSSLNLNLVYDPSIGAWRAAYSSTFSDLWRVGTWTLKVEAADTLGNSGTATYEVVAQPYLFLVVLAVLIAIALFGRWTVSRYGRKVYFRVRKIVQRFRPDAFA